MQQPLLRHPFCVLRPRYFRISRIFPVESSRKKSKKQKAKAGAEMAKKRKSEKATAATATATATAVTLNCHRRPLSAAATPLLLNPQYCLCTPAQATSTTHYVISRLQEHQGCTYYFTDSSKTPLSFIILTPLSTSISHSSFPISLYSTGPN